jgi:2,5-furandicarboxylate decarboxylase 1
MGNADLRAYLTSLNEKEMVVIDEPVQRDFVIQALCMELERRHQFPVLCFNRIRGCEIPFLTNLFADRGRIFRMLGAGEGDFHQKWLDAEKNAVKPTIVSRGQVQEIIQRGREVDVRGLPTIQYYNSDAGRYVTSAILVAKDPGTGIRNLSYHRLQVKSANRLGISLHSRQHLWSYFSTAETEDRPLEVAAIIGVHPLVMLAASAKAGIEVDEYDIAGGLLGAPLELVKGKTIDIEYPADAEIVIEGKILPKVNEDEGPFGEFTGYSTTRSTRNVFEVTAICRRKNPYYISIAAGASADHLNLARSAKEAVAFYRLKERVPNVIKLHYPRSGVNLHCVVSMKPGAGGSVRHALMLLFGLDPNIKLAIAVDEDIDPASEASVMWALATRMQGDEDIFVVPKVFTIGLDPSSRGGVGAKVGIDATMKPGFEAIVLREEPVAEEASEIIRKLLCEPQVR